MHEDSSSGSRGRPLSLNVDTPRGMRRTHSNPENCQSCNDADDDGSDNVLMNYGTLKAQASRRVNAENGGTVPRLETVGGGGVDAEAAPGLEIGEETALTRVNRWLSSIQQ